VKTLIERQKEKFGWEFFFLGANIDAVATAKKYGIGSDRAVNYNCDSQGTKLNYEVMSDAICSLRASKPLAAEWKRKIEQDYSQRGNSKK
jgi:hypothetical protein